MAFAATSHDYVPFDPRQHGAHGTLLRMIPPGTRVLDVGCSTGYLAEQLVSRGCTVIGLELDADAARLAERWCERVIVGDVETASPDLDGERFDVVLCGDILEHLRDPIASLARWRRLLRPDGRLVLSTPNIANWSIRAALLFGVFRYTDRGLLDRTHTHLFTRRSLRQALARAGYSPLVEDFTVPLPHRLRQGSLERAAHTLGGLRPTLFAYQWVFAAAPDASASSQST